MSQDRAFYCVSQSSAVTCSGKAGGDSFWAPPPCGDSSAAAVNELILLSLQPARGISEAIPPNLGAGAPPTSGLAGERQVPWDTEEGPKQQPSWKRPMQAKGGSLVDSQLPGRLGHSPPRRSEAGLGSATLEAVPHAQVPARSFGWKTQWGPRSQPDFCGVDPTERRGLGQEASVGSVGAAPHRERREEPVPAHPQTAGTPTHRPSGNRIPAPPQCPGLGPLRPARARQLHAAAASSARPVPAPPALSTGND